MAGSNSATRWCKADRQCTICCFLPANGSSRLRGFTAFIGFFWRRWGPQFHNQEFCVKKKDLTEVIAMIGLFGMLVSASEIPVLERKALESINWSARLMLAYAAYSVSSFLFYTLAPFVLKISGAMLFGLSLLTSDIWAVAIRTFIYKQKAKAVPFFLFYVYFLFGYFFPLPDIDF